MSELSSKAKKLFDEFNFSQTVYHAYSVSGMDNEYVEMKRKTRDAKRESFKEYVVGLESRIAELEAAHRWIPVKEKLPNLFETVLIWAYCDCDGYDRFDLAFNSGLVWVGTQQDIEYEDVTHWMPLPTPPEVTR